MRKFGLLGSSAICSAAFFGFALTAAPAYAQTGTQTTQDEPEDADPEELQSESEIQSGVDARTGAQGEDAEGETITVTGSRIRRPNLESTVPITSLGGEQIFQGSDPNLGETLNELPQLRSTFAQSNPGLGIGIAGLNLLDLRGLGTQRTLVLVNGRRHVPADILNNAVSPDVASIPNDLIERVDIVTGGNSAVYGSDAIAGVVNFVLRRNFDGFQIRGQASTTEEGFGGNQYVSAMFGTNFASDRGNVTVHGEYAHQGRIFGSDVPFFASNDGFFTVDADSGGLVSNSDNFPDAVFLRDVRSVSINRFGLVPITQPNTDAALCGRGTLANNGAPNNAGTAFNCTFLFTPTGSLVPQTGSRFGSGPLGGILGGNGQTGREEQLLSVLPFLERFNVNVLAHFEFSRAAEVFLEAKWNRVNALGNNAGPSFIQGQLTQFDFRERPRLDNPFLNPQDRTTLTNAILASGFEPRLVGRVALTPATRAQIEAGTFRFDLARSLLDVGIRDEDFRRDTHRVVAGLRGTFNGDWNYEISANFGKFEQETTTSGFIDRQRFVLSMDAGRNPATGAIQCRSQFDPAAAIPIQRTDPVSVAIAAQNAARLAADIAACVPYNPFGAANNAAAVDYFSRTFTAQASLEQRILTAFVSGDSSQIFELPGGPVSFALGVEHRREEAFYQQDEFVTQGFTNGVSIPTFAPDPFEVKEAFGELRIPILSDMPFFEELTVSAAGRVADYKGSVGTVYSYNAGVDWTPVRDIRFRGNYSRAVRAPNVSETAFPLVPNFAPGFTDPCNANRINQSTNRNANCTADLGALLPNIPVIAYSLPIVSGSNPNLQEETSDSYTLGAVIQPRFIPGFSLSVDYYDITVNGIIASVGAQGIVDACYDQPNLQNVFCQQFTRFRGPGTGPNGEAAGAILGNSLINAPLNFARRERAGIDVNMAYRTKFRDVGFNTNLIYTHNLKISNFQSATDPNFANIILGELGDPKDEFRWDTDFTFGAFTLGYRLRYIGPQFIGAAENTRPSNGNPPGNLDAFEIEKYPAITYSDLRFEWNIENGAGVADDLRFYFGVDNVFDRMAPFGLTSTGTSAIYEFRGRSFYGGFRARF